jgi:hypothetical protein
MLHQVLVVIQVVRIDAVVQFLEIVVAVDVRRSVGRVLVRRVMI